MTLIEHLEELWVRLLISLAAFGVMTGVGLLFVERILVLLRRVGRVVFLAPTEAFFVQVKVAALALFVAGGVVAFLVILPIGVRFLLSDQTENLVPMISVQAYTSFAMTFVLAFGLLFQLPVVILFLTRLGIVTLATLAAGRKYALLAIVIASAVLTPAGDIVSQLLMAAPTYL